MKTRRLTTALGAAALAALLAAPTFAAPRGGTGGTHFARSQGSYGASSPSRQQPAAVPGTGDQLRTRDQLHTDDQLPDQDQLRTRDQLHDQDMPDQDQLRTRDQLKDGTGTAQ
jgi:hypothetical protein